jgi:hypothetical protein
MPPSRCGPTARHKRSAFSRCLRRRPCASGTVHATSTAARTSQADTAEPWGIPGFLNYASGRRDPSCRIQAQPAWWPTFARADRSSPGSETLTIVHRRRSLRCRSGPDRRGKVLSPEDHPLQWVTAGTLSLQFRGLPGTRR